MSNYLPKYILWLSVHNFAFLGNKQFIHKKFKNDGSKQWSTCYLDNQFKFLSRIVTFTFMRR